MKNKIVSSIAGLITLFSVTTQAADLRITFFTTATHAPVGYITVTDTKEGLLIKPTLSGLAPGLHGFHVHQNPSCDDNGNAAGGHFDPAKTNRHVGPYSGNGHQGDMPVLVINAKGFDTLPVLAPHLTTKDLRNHSMIIHEGADNYSDNPPNGGGGARAACGIVK